MAEVQKSPEDAKPALTLLAALYGLTRVERNLAFFLAAGEPNLRCGKCSSMHTQPPKGNTSLSEVYLTPPSQQWKALP